MRRFTELYWLLTPGVTHRVAVEAVEDYFRHAAEADGSWAYALLSGCKLRRVVEPGSLRDWMVQGSGYPQWLVEVCHEQSGNWPETLAKLLPTVTEVEPGTLSVFMEASVLGLMQLDPAKRREVVVDIFRNLNEVERMLYLKWLTATFRPAKAAREALREASFDRPKLPSALTKTAEWLLFD